MAITHSTVHHFLENSAKLHGDKVAVVCGEKRLTYREINEAAEKFARYLILSVLVVKTGWSFFWKTRWSRLLRYSAFSKQAASSSCSMPQ